MGKLISFAEKQNRKREKKQSETPVPDAKTILLWRLSMGIDDIVTQGILDESLTVEEVSCILAHRLGTLTTCSQAPSQLLRHCIHILKRVNPPSASDKDKSA